jgi:hypothetical protein
MVGPNPSSQTEEHAMRHPYPRLIVIFALITMLTRGTSAAVVEVSVTPAYIKKDSRAFSITAEKRQDGLIHLTITHHLTAPRYLVAHFEISDGKTLVMKNDTASFVREDSATYYLAVSPKHLADSKFELRESSFGESGGKPVPSPGGTNYQIKLLEFGKDAPDPKADGNRVE